MKFFMLIVATLASFHFCSSFMIFEDLGEQIKRCYDKRDEQQTSDKLINGQVSPLPNSMEAFVSLVEELEGLYPSIKPPEMIRKLLISFRCDNVPSDLRFKDNKWKDVNKLERTFFGIESVNYAWGEKDIIDDDKCALHFMLSHYVNESSRDSSRDDSQEGFSKRSREYGVVNIEGKPKQAIALGKVLLGIFAGFISNSNSPVNAAEIRSNSKLYTIDDRLDGVKINRLIAVTIGDLVALNITSETFKSSSIVFMQNGEWNDVSCPIDYYLEDNSKPLLSNALIRGAIDGLIIGKKIENNKSFYSRLRLSEILRMYYGPTGLLEETTALTKGESRTSDHFCKRKEKFQELNNNILSSEILNYVRLYAYPSKTENSNVYLNDISSVVSSIQGSQLIFDEDESSICSTGFSATTEKFKTSTDIFAVLDWQTTDNSKKLQIELLGILSNDFEVRLKGSSLGAYANLSPTSSRGLHIVASNSSIAGCSACYAKYYDPRTGNTKQGEVEVMNYLNQTLTEFCRYQEEHEDQTESTKVGTSAKVVLYFNFGNPNSNDYRLRDAVWQITKNFKEVTMLAIGPKKDSLSVFTENDEQDIFTDIGNVNNLAMKLKSRISKAPAEFQFKECYNSNQGTEAGNKQAGFIPVNKKQYWAMYPKYFLKSFDIKLKFKALDGASIKVCFSRHHYRIIDENPSTKTCYESGEEIIFWEKNPCHKKNVYDCLPFYLSVEGQKTGNEICESRYCRTPKDIRFEFSHEGVSCNTASLLNSPIALVSLAISLIFVKTSKMF